MVTEKMKPCPFCGSTAVHDMIENDERLTASVKCTNEKCGCHVAPYDGKSRDAAIAWNRRAQAALSTDAEPVAARYDFDGYGFQYIDSGSGSDWKTRKPDAEMLYDRPQQPDFFELEEIREQKLATIAAPDNGTTAEVLAAVLECAEAWVPEARIIGNVRAGDIARVVRSALSAQVQDVAGWKDISTAPRDETPLLLCCVDWPHSTHLGKPVPIKVGGFGPNGWHVFGASWRPTHWMPLPAAPAAKQGEAD